MPSPALVSKDVLKTFVYPVCETRIFLPRGMRLVSLWEERKGHRKSRSSHTLYRLPSAPTEHPSSKYPIFFTIAAIPHELSRAARRPISLARARKNCRSASVVSRAKKWVNMPMIMSNSSVGSLPRHEPKLNQYRWTTGRATIEALTFPSETKKRYQSNTVSQACMYSDRGKGHPRR